MRKSPLVSMCPRAQSRAGSTALAITSQTFLGSDRRMPSASGSRITSACGHAQTRGCRVGLRVTQFLAVMLASLTPITARTKNQTGDGKALFVMSGAGGEDGFVRCLYNTTAETF